MVVVVFSILITCSSEAAEADAPCPFHPLPSFPCAAPGTFTDCAREDAVNSWVFCCVPRCLMPALLQRPGDRAIGRAIGLSVYELLASRGQLAGNRVLVGLPVKFLVE